MDPKDTFFKRLQPLEDFAKLFEKSERFGSWNRKTLGIVLVSAREICNTVGLCEIVLCCAASCSLRISSLE